MLLVESSFTLANFSAQGGNALTQELLRRLTRSGTMYLIPADIYTKRIIRFTVTSQHTTPDDILRDWKIICNTATALLAEKKSLDKVYQPKLEDQVIEEEENADVRTEDTAPPMDKVQVELWIDKAWNRPRRPMRSLSCSSEPLPYNYFGPLSGQSKTAAPGSGGGQQETEEQSNVAGKDVLKKLTKFNSVPSFCNPWVQCGRHQLCSPRKSSPAAPTPCRRANYTPPSSIINKAPPPTPLDTTSGPELM